jgi:hypothetical protein
MDEELLGQVVGQQIGNNARANGIKKLAEADRILANSEIGLLERTVDVLRKELEAVTQTEVDFTCAIAGVRGVTRELLEELRKSDPKNPLLDKRLRDRIFDSAFKKVNDRIPGTSYQKRRELSQALRDEAYGAEGANKSGPEKSQITPNLAVRAEAEVPSHVTDREKFLGLIEKLSAELKKANPDSPILKDKEMISVFEDYTLNNG